MFKDNLNGQRPVWLHTASSSIEGLKSSSVSEDGDELMVDNDGEIEKVFEEKGSKSNRRQKGLSGGGVLVGNPDLLTIPGVGPRNLKKLVEKGIGGVAELKQLYKDKVKKKKKNWPLGLLNALHYI